MKAAIRQTILLRYSILQLNSKMPFCISFEPFPIWLTQANYCELNVILKEPV